MFNLYLDLDGVMADFDEGFPRIFGIDHKKIPEEQMWKLVSQRPSFFEELNPMPGALEFFKKEAFYFNPIILTACPKVCWVDAAKAKKRWVHKHLHNALQIIPVWGGKHKVHYMQKEGDVLIDDWENNIKQWNLGMGIGILHKNFEDTTNMLNWCVENYMHRNACIGRIIHEL